MGVPRIEGTNRSVLDAGRSVEVRLANLQMNNMDPFPLHAVRLLQHIHGDEGGYFFCAFRNHGPFTVEQDMLRVASYGLRVLFDHMSSSIFNRTLPFTVVRSPFTVHRQGRTPDGFSIVNFQSSIVNRTLPFTVSVSAETELKGESSKGKEVHRCPFTLGLGPFTVIRSPFTVFLSFRPPSGLSFRPQGEILSF
jgi:hypothetical protein